MWAMAVNIVLVVKSVRKTVVIMVIRIAQYQRGNIEAPDDYRITKVQSRFLL